MYPPVEFLLIDGNPGDVLLTQECFKTHKIANPLNIVSDIRHALKFLRQQDEYASANSPDVILSCVSILRELDYDQFLDNLQSDHRLRNIPLVLLTEFEGEESHAGNAPPSSLFLPKPLSMDGLCYIINRLMNVSFAICKKV